MATTLSHRDTSLNLGKMCTRTIDELKTEAIKYFCTNGVPEKIEKVINKMFSDQPRDPNGYLSWFFSQCSSPSTVQDIVFGLSWNTTGERVTTLTITRHTLEKKK
ncbi:hypothetical protein AHF37_04801 [Paragonimus kellicotti]|nr:hypothetical protein AHF37_04801 [Paragonimus kellicotti]